MSTKKREHPHANHASHTEKRGGTNDKPAPVLHEVSDDEHSQLIQVRAYALWEQAGKPEGDAAREQFWCAAEKELTMSPARGT